MIDESARFACPARTDESVRSPIGAAEISASGDGSSETRPWNSEEPIVSLERAPEACASVVRLDRAVCEAPHSLRHAHGGPSILCREAS